MYSSASDVPQTSQGQQATETAGTPERWETAHLAEPQHVGGGMDNLYANLRLIPTSIAADIVLIRSYVAYWHGTTTAERTAIRPSRGHSYRVEFPYRTYKAVITDHYDHRDGVTLSDWPLKKGR